MGCDICFFFETFYLRVLPYSDNNLYDACPCFCQSAFTYSMSSQTLLTAAQKGGKICILAATSQMSFWHKDNKVTVLHIIKETSQD